ncbi:hypothetical protein BOX15_Mlig033059g1 [Macrostomum lignano]|uniref:Peptidase_M13_N domain-containing protein n=1 Tax=Macrostomum lignano TaxID=282301 RepID=A0A267D9R6_9PLAT|nr:hypothetical protein BOX15_Mlig033059g3 [Macrostomum lignano]PAA57115.1 hypothetical protein BOX15_Mlig033059g1 [Macrostomum lignano]
MQNRARNRSDYPSFSGPSYGQMGCGITSCENLQLDGVDAASNVASSTRPFLLTSASQAAAAASMAPASNGRRRRNNNSDDTAEGRSSGESYRRREKFLCCCCCTLTVGLLAVSGFLLLSYLPAFRPPNQPGSCAGGFVNSGSVGGGGPASYCLSRACLKSAAEMEELLNQTADPCKEFFAFSCDGWLNENHMPPTVPVWSRSTRLQSSVDNHLREMLEFNGDDFGWRTKLTRFFEACISVEDPRLAQCGTGGGGRSTGDEFQTLLNACQGPWKLTERIQCLQIELGVSTLFQMEPVQSPWSPGEQILLLKEHQDRSLGDISVPQERNGLRHFIIQLVNDLEHLGDSVGQNYADSVLTVLQSLAQISLPGSHPLKDHPLLRAQRMSIAEFKQRLKASGKPLIHFDKLIAQFIHGDPEVNIDSMVIAVDNPNYFYRLENLLKTLRDDDLKKYLEFCIIRHFAPYYSAKSRRDCLRHSAQLNGQEHAEEQWLTCLRLLRSPGLNAVYFGEMKAKLRLGMISNVLVPLLKEAFVELVRSRPTLSQQTKQSIATKVKSMRFIIGYSEQHLQPAFLDEYFREWNLTSNQTLLQMVTGWTKFLQFRARARLKSNRSTFEETLDITSVYPSYHIEENAVFVPAAFFQWPFHMWDNSMPYYLKFGIIGSAIAAQMTKAFDAIGSLWTGLEDLAVNEQPLLLSSEAENCYASLQATVDTTSKATIRLAFATAWGLRVAQLAHEMHLMRRTDKQLGLPTLSYSADQLLFMAFAQTHCGTERAKYKLRLRDSYFPMKNRVEFAVQGSPVFNRAFSCHENQMPETAWTCSP